MDKNLILYPCYFDAGLTRKQGRRIPLNSASTDPTMTELLRAMDSCQISYKKERKSHPAYWSKREGRVLIAPNEKKGIILERVAAALKKVKS